jgi:hypothetical protein
MKDLYYVEFYGGTVYALSRADYIKLLEKVIIEGTGYYDTLEPSTGRKVCADLRSPLIQSIDGKRSELTRVRRGE